jgi:hypothetical protein
LFLLRQQILALRLRPQSHLLGDAVNVRDSILKCFDAQFWQVWRRRNSFGAKIDFLTSQAGTNTASVKNAGLLFHKHLAVTAWPVA